MSKELSLAVNNRLMIFPFKISDTKPQGAFEYYLSDTHWLDAINQPMSKSIEHMERIVSLYLKTYVSADFNPQKRVLEEKEESSKRQKDNLKYKLKRISRIVEWGLLIFLFYLFILFIYCDTSNEWHLFTKYYFLLQPLGILYFMLSLIGLAKPELLLCNKRSSIGYLFVFPLFLCAIIGGNAEDKVNAILKNNRIGASNDVVINTINVNSLNKGTELENKIVNKILNNMVCIDSSLYVCKYELTCYEWECIMGYSKNGEGIGNYPVQNITEKDCHDFLLKIRDISGIAFNIPTVDEWLKVSRDNYQNYFQYAGGDIIDEVAWYKGNSKNIIHPVGLKKPTKLGVFDLSGNVWEYCYSEDFGYCTAKGGSAYNDDNYCRLVDSSGDSIYIEPFEMGIRLVINNKPVFNLPE